MNIHEKLKLCIYGQLKLYVEPKHEMFHIKL